jgi:hypothetical protein
MSTADVPGANPKNHDVLSSGCWAEHADGSLIFVKGTELDQVVYEIFDVAADPPVSYTDAMPETAFKKSFSFPPSGVSTEKWTWHDKTPFPWNRVMQSFKRPRPTVHAEEFVSAAARVAESLRLRAHALHEESVRAHTDQPATRGRAVLQKLSEALEELLK